MAVNRNDHHLQQRFSLELINWLSVLLQIHFRWIGWLSRIHWFKPSSSSSSSRHQVRPWQWARQRQWGHVLRALPALHPPHPGHGQTLHPQGFFILLRLLCKRNCSHRPWQPRASHATAPGRVSRLRRRPGVFLRRRHHEVPLREAGGLFGNDVSCFRPHGQRQGSAGRVHNR